MNEEDLKRCDELMGCRDHWQMNTEDFNRKNLYALADEVPGLVEEVRKLNLQIDVLKGEVEQKTGYIRELSDALEVERKLAAQCHEYCDTVDSKLEESNRLNGELQRERDDWKGAYERCVEDLKKVQRDAISIYEAVGSARVSSADQNVNGWRDLLGGIVAKEKQTEKRKDEGGNPWAPNKDLPFNAKLEPGAKFGPINTAEPTFSRIAHCEGTSCSFGWNRHCICLCARCDEAKKADH